jgi:hypothetical protein
MKFILLFAAAYFALPAPQDSSYTSTVGHDTTNHHYLDVSTPPEFDIPTPPSHEKSQSRHIVAYGETIESIASFNAMFVEGFKALNPGKSDLKAGDQVMITKPTCTTEYELFRAFPTDQSPYCVRKTSELNRNLSPCTKLGGRLRAVLLHDNVRIFNETSNAIVGIVSQTAESLNVAQFANILQTSESVLQDLNPNIATMIPRNSSICAPEYKKYECKGYKVRKSNEILEFVKLSDKTVFEQMRTMNPTISDWTAIPDGLNICINVNPVTMKRVPLAKVKSQISKFIMDLNPQITDWNVNRVSNSQELIVVPQNFNV